MIIWASKSLQRPTNWLKTLIYITCQYWFTIIVTNAYLPTIHKYERERERDSGSYIQIVIETDLFKVLSLLKIKHKSTQPVYLLFFLFELLLLSLYSIYEWAAIFHFNLLAQVWKSFYLDWMKFIDPFRQQYRAIDLSDFNTLHRWTCCPLIWCDHNRTRSHFQSAVLIMRLNKLNSECLQKQITLSCLFV